MEHSQIILNVLQERNISAYKLAKETGISESLFSKWKKKPTSDIASSNLARIAEYLDCSVDSLLGRDMQKEKPAPKDRDGPGETTQQFVRLVNKLTPEQQQLLLAQLQAWTEQNQQQALAVPQSSEEKDPKFDL